MNSPSHTTHSKNHLKAGRRRATRRKGLLLAVLPVLGFGLPEARACDACNLAFANEIVGERAGTPVADDLRRAMENQRGLKLDGYSNPSLMEAQMAKLDESKRGTAAASEPAGPVEEKPENCCGGPDCGMGNANAAEGLAEDPSGATGTADSPSPVETGRSAVEEGPDDPAAAGAVSVTAPPSGFQTGDRAAKAAASGLSPISQGREMPAYMADANFIEILERDYELPTTPYSTVPQNAPVDKSVTVRMSEGTTYIGNGVVYDGFHMDGKIPGPTVVADVGDVVEMSFVNEGTIAHGASIHAAYTQTSKYVGKIAVGETKSVRFRAMMPGVYMYHCAPGGHAIGMHVIGGQYGMIVIRPEPGSYRLEKELGHEPNIELFLIQHELYASGKDSISGDPEYVLFNGRTFRYIEKPIMANPGDYVRINFLNVGPNILSTFHIVGILWDYVYWQGHPEAKLSGGQSVTAGPSDSFVIEFRMPPDEGAYTMLTHAVGSTNRGAIGLIVVDGEADLEPHRTIMADGPSFNDAEMRGYEADATRVIAPFGIGTAPVDRPVVYGPETEEVHVSIIGNSYHPKVIQVAPGTKVTWTNEDVFTYLAGEYAGIHNAASTNRPEDGEGFNGDLIAHGESWSHTFGETEFEYDYHCTPHPYMRGKVIVKEPEYSLAGGAPPTNGSGSIGPWVLPLIGLCLLLATGSLVARIRPRSGNAD